MVKYVIKNALTAAFTLFSIYIFGQASLQIQSTTGLPGIAVIVPVTATGIEDMTGFQFTIEFDTSKLEYVTCSNWGGGTRENGVQITPLAGKVTFVYNDDAVNIASGKFFDLHFNIKAGTSGTAFLNWIDNPTMRELSNSVPEEINCEYDNGSIEIETITNPEISAPVATAATAVSQTGFTANWNSVANATGYYLDVSTNESFSTFLAGFNNKNVNNVTSFPLTGLSPGETYFYRIRAYNSEITSENSNTVSVNTQSESAESTTLSIGTAEGISGSEITVPVTATGIEDMTGFQFTIEFDDSKLEYVSCSNWGGGARETGVQITPLEGKVTFVYNDDAVNIASGKFFDLHFNIKAGTTGTAFLNWSDNPTMRELSNSVPVEIPCEYTNGFVTIQEKSELTLSVSELPSFGEVKTDSCSGTQSYWITGKNLVGDVVLTAPAGFEVSTSASSGFKNILNLTPYQGNISIRIHVRFCPSEGREYSGEITHTSTETETNALAVAGTGISCLLEVIPESVVLKAEGDTVSFSVISNSTWTMFNKDNEPVTGPVDGDYSGELTIPANDSDEELIYTYTLIADCGKEVTWQIVQNCWIIPKATASLSFAEGYPGELVKVPVTVSNFLDVTGFQFTIEYDSSQLEFADCSNWGGDIKASAVQITPLNGKITFVYNDATINITEEKLVDLDFAIKESANDTARIIWSDNPTARELSNSVPLEIPCEYDDGAVIVLEKTPVLNISITELPSFEDISLGDCSPGKTYTLNGSNLKNNVLIAAPDGFEISASFFGSFTDTLELTNDELNGNNKTIYVRFCPEEARDYSGEIVHSSTNADTLKIQVNGTGKGDCFIFGTDGFKYILTTDKYDETDDLSLAVKNEFGQNAEVADWNDLKTNFGNDIITFLDGICIYESNPESAFVQWNGEYLYSSNRHYFLRRVDGEVPSGFLVHDEIADNTLILGSWFDLNNKILAKIDTTLTSTPALSDIPDFTVYPNPVSDVLHITFNNTHNQELQVELVTIHGKVLRQQVVSNLGFIKINMPVSGLSPGIYLVRIKNNFRKIVITKKSH